MRGYGNRDKKSLSRDLQRVAVGKLLCNISTKMYFLLQGIFISERNGLGFNQTYISSRMANRNIILANL